MSSDWYSAAIRRPMPYADSQPMREQRRVLIMHTNGGGTDNGSLYGWFSRPGNTVCSHFQIMWDGTCEQYMPLSRQAYAQHDGNDFGISLEFQDDGNAANPMTDLQMAVALDITSELGVPVQKAGESGSPEGLGYHGMYQSWNKNDHDCPGAVRLEQWRHLYTDLPLETEWSDPVNIITKSDGSAARIMAVDASNGIKVYAVMSGNDLSAFRHMAPGAVVFSALPTADYNHLVSAHG
jgi:hypothetical protein